jgi:tRNA-dihydrouridine synthase
MVVKGVRFREHRIVGDILELAERYRDAGADELVFYDITASPEGRSVDRGWVTRVARVLDIPFCVAGGIRSVADAEEVLGAGAEKISVNSPALADPDRNASLSALTARPPTRDTRYISSPATRRERARRDARPSIGSSKLKAAAPAKSCSTAWRATACGRATTFRNSPQRAPHAQSL